MATHVRPTVLKADGRFAAGILMSDGHTVRGEYKHPTYEDAEADAQEWFEREIAAAPTEEDI